jgi:hypothetical protein
MNRRKDYLPAALSLALLAAIAIGAMGRPSPADAQAYHLSVRRAIESLPQRIGDWVGTDEPLPPAALELLQPNAVLHRTYRGLASGQSATLLIVQCKDARDLAGHYPPICYPAHGWTLDHQSPRHWTSDGMAVEGTEYEFSYGTIAGAQRMVVANFMLLPDGRTSPDMAAVYRTASDYQRRFYGAAQVQIVTDARLPEQQRQRIIADFVGAHADVFRTILNGGTP